MPKRERQWRINGDVDVLDAFADALEELGVNQKTGTLRLMSAWLAMPAELRSLMVSMLTPERVPEVARAILREMGRKR